MFREVTQIISKYSPLESIRTRTVEFTINKTRKRVREHNETDEKALDIQLPQINQRIREIVKRHANIKMGKTDKHRFNIYLILLNVNFNECYSFIAF